MFDNNLIFSFVLSVVNTIAFLLIKNNDDEDLKNQELLMLFSVTFITSFLLRSFMSGELMKGGSSENILTHSPRAPF